MGEVVEMRPFSTSASSLLTSLYSTSTLALQVKYNNAGAVAGTILGNIGEIEHAEVAHALFEMADFGVDVTLAFFGVFVLGVFGEVAVRASDGDFLGKLDVELVLESDRFPVGASA